MRFSGILLPVYSLASPYGIGSFGKEAFEFIDFLDESGQKLWQILPMGPTGEGNSPYSSLSSFAMNPLFIDLDLLTEEGLLTEKEIKALTFGEKEEEVDYEAVISSRNLLLRKAFENFDTQDENWKAFLEEENKWLDDYSLFQVLRKLNEGSSWQQWEDKARDRDKEYLEALKKSEKEEYDFHCFCQYKAFAQWYEVKDYAHKKGIKILGDLAIYVTADSCDAWVYPQALQLDESKNPIYEGGTPPDAFSSRGQGWGMPVYNWEYLKETGYTYWIDRLRNTLTFFDMVRLDHFRGFSKFWRIPSGEPPIHGSWIEGPGEDFFLTVFKEYPKEKFIAEDLGTIDEDVRNLIEKTQLPGMRVLQFAFAPGEESIYLPHHHIPKDLVYTGTHDNSTVAGWFEEAPEEEVRFAMEYLRINKEDHPVWEFIACAMSSVCYLCILQAQDLMGLPGTSRTNIPAVSQGNWKWRLKKGQPGDRAKEKLLQLTKLYGRYHDIG